MVRRVVLWFYLVKMLADRPGWIRKGGLIRCDWLKVSETRSSWGNRGFSSNYWSIMRVIHDGKPFLVNLRHILERHGPQGVADSVFKEDFRAKDIRKVIKKVLKRGWRTRRQGNREVWNWVARHTLGKRWSGRKGRWVRCKRVKVVLDTEAQTIVTAYPLK